MTNVVKIAARAAETNGFEAFWELCPKRVHKVLALAKWQAITSEKGLHTATLDRDSGKFIAIWLQATPEVLTEAMRKYRKAQFDSNTYKLKDDGRYTLHPATWLNQGRWEDE